MRQGPRRLHGSSVEAERLVHGLVDAFLERATAPLLVEVEAAAVLATVAMVVLERGKDLRRAEPLAVRLAHGGRDVRGDVDAALVEQLQRPGREAPVDERAIDGVDGDSLGEELRGLVQVRREDARRVEAGAVVDDDDVLALALAHRDGGGDRARIGVLSAHHLEERAALHRRKIVHSEDAFGTDRHLGDARNGQRRRVRRDDAGVLHEPLEIADDGVLEREVLEDRLDHQVGVAEAGVVGGAGEAREGLFAMVGGDQSALDALVDGALHVVEPASERDGVGVLHSHGEAGLDAHARNACAHEARADHRHALDAVGLGALLTALDAGVLLGRGGGEEELDETTRRLADHQLAEQACLERGGGTEAALSEALEHVEHACRRGIMTEGLLRGLVARATEEERATERGLLDEDALDRTQAGHRLAAMAEPRAALGEALPEVGPRRETEREATRGLEETRHRDHLVDEAERERLRRRQAATGEPEVDGDPKARALGDADEAIRGGHEPELHLGQAEDGLRVVARDGSRARERELEAAAERSAVDARHHRLARRRHACEALARLERRLFGVRREAQGLEVIDVGADEEGVLLRAPEHHCLHACVAFRALQRGRELGAELRRDRVVRLVGIVEGEHRHAVGADVDPHDGRRVRDWAEGHDLHDDTVPQII